jgi:drug/metabolite transporter (DMT)-like permease
VTGGADIGVGMALLATTAYNSGLIVEKQALGRLPAISGRRAVSMALTLLSSPRWLCGFALMLCGLGFQVLSLMLAPVTVVQPIMASGVAVVLILSRLVLREHLSRSQYVCVAVMALSVVLLALSTSGTTEVGHQVDGLRIAAVALPSCLFGLLIAFTALQAGARKHRTPVTGVSYGIATGLLYGVAALAIKALSGALLHSHGVIGALIAVVSSPYLYVMAACSAAGLLLFQTALQRCRISIVAPVSNVLGSIYFMVVGTWLFHERLPADPVRLALRLVGIVVACGVVVLLSRQPDPTARPAPQPRLEPRRGPAGPVVPEQGGAYLTLGGEAHGPGRDAA